MFGSIALLRITVVETLNLNTSFSGVLSKYYHSSYYGRQFEMFELLLAALIFTYYVLVLVDTFEMQW